MRVIAGECKGRKLFSPGTGRVRPTSDKVKGAIFSIAGPIDGAVVMDAFSGSGSLGVEALSRGADFCYFCDNSQESCELTRRNVELCGLASRAKIMRGSYERAFTEVRRKIDLLLMDPPYHNNYYVKCFEMMRSCGTLSDEGMVVAEHDAKIPLPDRAAGLVKIKERKYGGIGVAVFVKG